MEKICFEPIGVIHTPFKSGNKMPRQSTLGRDIRGNVEVFPEFEDGLQDVDGFSHIVLLFYLHLVKGYSLNVVPYMETRKRGLFSTRAPSRPNPIGLSVVRVDRIEKNIIHIRDLDMIDGTPLLDIKPYIRQYDKKDKIRLGWIEKRF